MDLAQLNMQVLDKEADGALFSQLAPLLRLVQLLGDAHGRPKAWIAVMLLHHLEIVIISLS